MIADLTEEQRKLMQTGDRTVAARRLRELLLERNELRRTPSREECDAIIDLLVAGIGHGGA